MDDNARQDSKTAQREGRDDDERHSAQRERPPRSRTQTEHDGQRQILIRHFYRRVVVLVLDKTEPLTLTPASVDRQDVVPVLDKDAEVPSPIREGLAPR